MTFSRSMKNYKILLKSEWQWDYANNIILNTQSALNYNISILFTLSHIKITKGINFCPVWSDYTTR